MRWYGFLIYWLMIVGAGTATSFVGGLWPPGTGARVAFAGIAAIATITLGAVHVYRRFDRRRAIDRKRAVEALDTLNITSANARARFLGEVSPFLQSVTDDSDELANRMHRLFHAIARLPAGAVDLGRLHDLQESARKQRELERRGAHWLPPHAELLFPELGPSAEATEWTILGAGFGLAGVLLVAMSGRPLPSLAWLAGLSLLIPVLAGLADRFSQRMRRKALTAAPGLFSADGSLKIPEGFDRTRN